MKLIDMHVHMFPDRLAPKALGRLAETCHTRPFADGTAEGTKAALRSWGVSGATVMNIATKPSQQRTVNDWAAKIQDGFFRCFGSVHPAAEDAAEELARIKALGLSGVKLHPDYQDFFVDEERMFPIYETLSALGLPVTFHAGRDPISPDVIHARSCAIAGIAGMFPRLTVIAAHMGGLTTFDEAEESLIGMENVYLDTALACRSCGAEQMKRMIRGHGAERILFASDCPWSRSRDELDFLQKLGLRDDELEQILYKNAERLLGL